MPTTVTEASLSISADGDVDTVSLDYGADDLVVLTPGDAASLYSLDYLRDMNQAIPADATVALQFGTETPISLEYAVADGEGTVEYILSPRIVQT